MQTLRLNNKPVLATVAVMIGLILAMGAQGVARASEPDEEAAAAAKATTNNLKLISIAMHNHHDVFKTFPPAIIAKDGKPLLSWRVKLLPFLEEQALYTQFHRDEPWDSEHNKALIAKMPAVYQSPYLAPGDGRTVYVTPRGEKTAFPGERGVRIREVADGTSKTISLLEVDDDRAVIWTKPDDWNLDPRAPTAGLGGQVGDGFWTAFLDGSVHFLPSTIDHDTLNRLFTHNGREPVDVPDAR